MQHVAHLHNPKRLLVEGLATTTASCLPSPSLPRFLNRPAVKEPFVFSLSSSHSIPSYRYHSTFAFQAFLGSLLPLSTISAHDPVPPHLIQMLNTLITIHFSIRNPQDPANNPHDDSAHHEQANALVGGKKSEDGVGIEAVLGVADFLNGR